MPKITQIKQDGKTRRILVYIDYRFCASIRPNIWDAMELKDGDKITCAQLHQKEREIYQKSGKQNRVYSNKQALNRVVRWFDKYIPVLDAKIVDFKFGNNGFDSIYDRHDQNISLFKKGTSTELITLEVASSEIQRGIHHWVSIDKIMYAHSQTKRDGWIVVYYKYPVEKLVWIKPNPKILYKGEEIIKGSKYSFVFFKNDSPEVYSSPKFFEYIQARIDGEPPQQIDENVSETHSKIIKIGSLSKSNEPVVFYPKAFPTNNDTE